MKTDHWLEVVDFKGTQFSVCLKLGEQIHTLVGEIPQLRQDLKNIIRKSTFMTNKIFNKIKNNN